ncbi:hypothetical protein Acsp06_45650 [Actinomycetospora sp. NBRC 106375]|uniref:DUF5996 family protein n=1 Tax=Actinomycetospora sp. NBRC 106375 TaxID=3032207 RepID=UPI0024A12E1B|nr:DUF5996 family protein [Actinomycetospora sp. NBRC 106375]GLZ48380.1 hypothetical protein Acsp06_45650 [Actinomycetospora sp. NBRC 106375]
MTELFPALPYEDWIPTRETLHRFAQIVGKVRLAASPRRNHWWNVPLHLSGRGLTTRPMTVDGARIFCLDLDLVDHRLDLTTADGGRWSFSLRDRSVASFSTDLTAGLAALDLPVVIADPRPFDLPDHERPFAADTEHATYDPGAVTRYWRILGQVNLLLEQFAGRYSGKTSPVHHFWHTFDIALTRFSDRVIGHGAETDPVTREAYSREVISSGFWFGDPTFPEPAFYSYTAPEPDGLPSAALSPPSARWLEKGGAHLAVLTYADARATADPRATVLDFYETAYDAGAVRAGWPASDLACAGGVTDPVLATSRAARPGTPAAGAVR